MLRRSLSVNLGAENFEPRCKHLKAADGLDFVHHLRKGGEKGRVTTKGLYYCLKREFSTRNSGLVSSTKEELPACYKYLRTLDLQQRADLEEGMS